MYIYKITNVVNNKIYIGKTSKSIEERFAGHLYAMSSYRDGKYKKVSRLYASMCKYGADKFVVSEVEIVDNPSQLDEREVYWIKRLDSTNPAIGYNIAPGGNGGALFKGHKHSAKSKLLMSEKRRGQPSNRAGVSMTQDQKDKISRSLKNHYLDSINIEKHSHRAIKSWGTRKLNGTTTTTNGLHRYNNGEVEVMSTQCPEGFVEGALTTPHRVDGYQKMAKTNHLRHLNRYHKKVTNINKIDFKKDYEVDRLPVNQLMEKYNMTREEIALYVTEYKLQRDTYSRKDNSIRCSRPVQNIETGEIFKSISEASLVHRGAIGLACKNSKRTANGYHWRYLDESKT